MRVKMYQKVADLALTLIVNISVAVEKGPGSFQPMGTELLPFKVGVSCPCPWTQKRS